MTDIISLVPKSIALGIFLTTLSKLSKVGIPSLMLIGLILQVSTNLNDCTKNTIQ